MGKVLSFAKREPLTCVRMLGDCAVSSPCKDFFLTTLVQPCFAAPTSRDHSTRYPAIKLLLRLLSHPRPAELCEGNGAPAFPSPTRTPFYPDACGLFSAPAPTPAPVAEPTPSPTAEPTPEPVEPTPEPTPEPTMAPTTAKPVAEPTPAPVSTEKPAATTMEPTSPSMETPAPVGDGMVMYEYVGCFEDRKDDRILEDQLDSDLMTTEVSGGTQFP